jgi:hypothetical protein
MWLTAFGKFVGEDFFFRVASMFMKFTNKKMKTNLNG